MSVKDPLNTSPAIDSLTLINPSPEVELAGDPLSTRNLTSIYQQYVATPTVNPAQQIRSQHIAYVEHWHAVSQSGPRQTWQVKTPVSSFTSWESKLGQLDDEGKLMVDGSIDQMMSRKTSGITFSLLSHMYGFSTVFSVILYLSEVILETPTITAQEIWFYLVNDRIYFLPLMHSFVEKLQPLINKEKRYVDELIIFNASDRIYQQHVKSVMSADFSTLVDMQEKNRRPNLTLLKQAM